MIECICIDDTGRPEVIPLSKWVKKDSPYSITYTVLVLPQKQIGVHLAEIELTNKELPYEYFLLSRFGFTEENLLKLIALIKECSDTHFSLNELLQQTRLTTETA